MKKTLILFVLLPLLFSARASDTLTIRQIFTFNIGDIFDYQTYHWVSFPPTTGFSATDYLFSYDCSEQIVTDRFYSPDSSEVYYVLSINQSTKSLSYIDTIRYGFMDSSIIAYDTVLPPSDTMSSYNVNYTTDSSFSSYFHSTHYQFNRVYKARLGLTYSDQTSFTYNSLGVSGDQYITRLVYYSTSWGHWGTPCSVLLGSEDMASIESIHLYPTPTSNVLHLNYPEASQHSTHLIITDLLGQQVYSSSITETESAHDISGLPAGIYTWRLITEQGTIKTGKVLKQ